MMKKIGRKVYNTEKSKLIGENCEGSFGEPTGFKEILYMKAKEDFFLLVSGGIDSQYPEEDIIPIEYDDASEWIERNCDLETIEEFIQ